MFPVLVMFYILFFRWFNAYSSQRVCRWSLYINQESINGQSCQSTVILCYKAVVCRRHGRRVPASSFTETGWLNCSTIYMAYLLLFFSAISISIKREGMEAKWLVPRLWIKQSGVEPWLGHCIVFLGKTLFYYLTTPRCKIGMVNLILGLAFYPGRSRNFLVAWTCYRRLHLHLNACVKNMCSPNVKRLCFKSQPLKFPRPNWS